MAIFGYEWPINKHSLKRKEGDLLAVRVLLDNNKTKKGFRP